MSVAAATTAEAKASSPMGLVPASYIGGIYVLAALAVIFNAIPRAWQTVAASMQFGNVAFWSSLIVIECAAAALLFIFGNRLAGPNPVRGLRGGITVAISSMITAFFLIKGVLQIGERMANKFEFGQVLSLIGISICIYLYWKFLKSDRMERWSLRLEAAGWFDTNSYKRNQGLRVRRATMLGIFIVFGSGIYTMIHNNVITSHDWIVAIPFTGTSVLLLPAIKWTIPLILIGLMVWFAWRVVNYPIFADFLIATEAEINKVSWTPRAKLLRDTVVVLVTVFIITMFLFVVDVFWGTLLSREIVGILPSESEKQRGQTTQVNPNEW